MGKPMLLKAEIGIEAGVRKPTRLHIVAYRGGLMDIAGWGSVVVNLSGLELPTSVPILGDHENKLDSVVGSGQPAIRGGELHIVAKLADSAASESVRKLLESGVTLSASVGVAPKTVKRLRAGESVTVNGKTLQVPANGATLVEAGTLKEVSILPIAADSDTVVSLAARAALGVNDMANDTKTDVETIRAEERERLQAIDHACVGLERNAHVMELRARAIDDELSIETLQTSCLEALRASRNAGPIIRSGSTQSGAPVDVLCAAVLLHTGRRDVAEKELGADVTQQGESLRCRSLMDLCASAVQAEHGHIPSGKNELIRAAFSTVSLPTALGDSAQKIAMNDYRAAPSTWRAFADIVSVQNFKTHSQIRCNWGGAFTEVGSGGELKHGSLTESVYPISIDTSGEIFSMTRQSIVNDDLSLLLGAARALGRSAARAISDAMYELILGNADDYFHADHNNFFSGATSALDVTSLGLAIEKLRKQTDADGKLIDIVPHVLAVPPELESSARALLSSTTLARYTASGTDRQPEGSPIPKDLQLVVEPRISLSSYVGYSVKHWFLFASPQDSAFSVGFLNGVESPVVEVVDPPPDLLGTMWRGYLDFGVAAGDWHAAVRSKGEA